MKSPYKKLFHLIVPLLSGSGCLLLKCKLMFGIIAT
nr:MAG TPA: hypothetical protein [Caudoviricetes sp.]